MSRFSTVKIVSLLWLSSILGAGCAFLTQILLARELGPAAFGVFAAALSMVMLVSPMASFGVGGAWLKVFGEEGWRAIRWLRSSFSLVAITTLLIVTVLLAWAILGPHDATTRGLLIVLSTYLFGQVALELVSSKLQLEENYVGLAVWQFLPHLLRLLLVAMLAFVVTKLMTLHNVAYVYALISVGIFLIGTFFLSRMSRGQLALKGHDSEHINSSPLQLPSNIKELAVHSWPFALAGVFHLVYFQSDIILLKYIVNNEAAGIYNVAFIIMAAVYILPSVIYQKFLIPKIHRWANHDRVQFYWVYQKGNVLMLGLGITAMLAIWLLAPLGIRILFGENYTNAVLPLTILALAAPIRFVATSVGATLVTQEHMQRKVYYMGGTALINLALNVFLIPTFGILGAAIATVASELVLLLLYFRGAKLVFAKEAIKIL